MPIVQRAISRSPKILLQSIKLENSVLMPKRFQLNLEIGALPRARRASIKSMQPLLEFSTAKLLALAWLRHVGAPYPKDKAIAKETFLWDGWVDIHKTGPNAGRLLINGSSGNTGRQTEFSASLGELISLAIFVDILNVPLAHIRRIPECGPGKMDFLTTAIPGGGAVEGKSGHGSCLAAKKKEIAIQMRGQAAHEKYGTVVCYEKRGSNYLKKKGSSVYIYDPAGTQTVNETPLTGVLDHYRGICELIGLPSLTAGISDVLNGSQPGQASPGLEAIANVDVRGAVYDSQIRRQLAWRNSGIALRIREDVYICRIFDVDSLLGRRRSASSLVRLVLFGISIRILKALAVYSLTPASDNAEKLINMTCGEQRKHWFDFELHKDGESVPIHYTGLEDGTIRIDLRSLRQAEYEDLDYVS